MTGNGIIVQDDLSRFQQTFERYWKLQKGSRIDALAHTGRNFIFALARRLRALAEPRGEITKERISALEQGGGLLISDRARQLVTKRYNGKKQPDGALASQELRLREGHRMFTASSARFRGDLKQTTFSRTRSGKQLGRAKPVPGGEEKDSFVFDWSGQIAEWSGVAAVGLTSPNRRKAFGPALEDARRNMLTYIDRKHHEAAQRARRVFR
jgi:hypothetical protein